MTTHIRYGGNTSCVEMRCGEERLLFDSGTGIRRAAARFARERQKSAFLFYSHTHWDHIHALPFFQPGYDSGFDLRIFAGHLSDDGGIQKVLSEQMTPPCFPIPIEYMKGLREFFRFPHGRGMAFDA